jgi:hypothetical protein
MSVELILPCGNTLLRFEPLHDPKKIFFRKKKSDFLKVLIDTEKMTSLWGFNTDGNGTWVYFRASGSSEIAQYIVNNKQEHTWIKDMCEFYTWDFKTLDYDTVYGHIHYQETDEPKHFHILDVIDA